MGTAAARRALLARERRGVGEVDDGQVSLSALGARVEVGAHPLVGPGEQHKRFWD